MIFRTNRQHAEELEMIYDDGLNAGLQMGYFAAQTHLKNLIASIEGAEWVLDELEALEQEPVEDDE